MKFFHLNNPRLTVWEHHFEQTNKKKEADIWVANTESILVQAIEECIQQNTKKPKKLFLWTSEPYYSTTTNTKSQIYGIPVEIFNLWNKRSLFHNGTFLFQNVSTLPPKPEKRQQWRSSGPQSTCALITYPQETSIQATQERITIAKQGHLKGVCAIYGKGWPPGYSLENSRDGEWWKSKPSILAKYDFCLAMENSLQPYYVSEKLWDSILNGCLPIYCDNGTIYKDFPKDSFLDIRDYKSIDEVWDKVSTMSLEEWNRRFDVCWEAMVNLWKKGQQGDYWVDSVKEIEKALTV